jgi:hypothetical protein
VLKVIEKDGKRLIEIDRDEWRLIEIGRDQESQQISILHNKSQAIT